LVTGAALHKLGPPWTIMIAMCAFLAGSIILTTAPVHQTYWAQLFVSVVVMPWGMDMSFPSATIILSNAFKREHQGVAASLVMTVVNYSISIGLGMAGTVESHQNDGGRNALKGYRSAFYLGVGLAALGVCVGILFVSITKHEELKSRMTEVSTSAIEMEEERSSSKETGEA